MDKCDAADEHSFNPRLGPDGGDWTSANSFVSRHRILRKPEKRREARAALARSDPTLDIARGRSTLCEPSGAC